jgi:hypothetical protein
MPQVCAGRPAPERHRAPRRRSTLRHTAATVVVHRTALWVLIVACSMLGVVYAVVTGLRREYYATHRSWHEAPWRALKHCADAALTGMGLGLAAATVIFVVAAVVALITPFH